MRCQWIRPDFVLIRSHYFDGVRGQAFALFTLTGDGVILPRRVISDGVRPSFFTFFPDGVRPSFFYP